MFTYGEWMKQVCDQDAGPAAEPFRDNGIGPEGKQKIDEQAKAENPLLFQ